MQGSRTDAAIEDQDYRRQIKGMLALHLPEADVYDPLDGHSDSVDYDDPTGSRVFFEHNRMCGEVDVLLAFAPFASMGTAIEMWEAHRHGRAVIAISPLAHNWTIRFLSHEVYPSVERFGEALADGTLARRLAEILADGQNNG